MRPKLRFLALCAVLPALAIAPAIGRAAEGFMVVASDAGGVTLRLQVPQWSLSPTDLAGRASILGVSGSHSLAEPGRALVPGYSGLIAIPPDARPVLRVLESSPQEWTEGVRLRIAGRPVFRDAGDGLGHQPEMAEVEPVRDGLWPGAIADLGASFAFRGRRLASVEVRPFRYDESASRLATVRSLTVRIDFNRTAGARSLPAADEDRHFDPVLASKVLNWEQAKVWRSGKAALAAPARRTSATSRLGGTPLAEPTVRVRCDSTALYYLPFSELSAKGYPGGVPVAEVSVHRREYVEGSDPPFLPLELACDVMDVDADGTFGPGDGVWVYVRSWASRSGASQLQRMWGDAEVVFVTRNRAGGLRMPSRRGWRDASGLSDLASFPHQVRLDRNFASYMPFVGLPNDTNVAMFHWTEISFYYNRPDTLRFETNDIDTSRTVQFSVNWVGRRFNSHYMWAAVRNNASQVTSVADSVSWSNKTPFTATGTLRGSALSEGRTNFLRFWGKSLSSPPDPVTNNTVNVGLDWFEYTYWRSLRAIRSYLAFNSGDATDLVQFRASRFLSDSLRVYDVTAPESPVRILIDPSQVSIAGGAYTLVMQDSIVAGQRRSYVAAGSDGTDLSLGGRVPPASAFTAVVQRDLHLATSGDYLIVVPEAFLPAVQPLVDLRTSEGLRVLVAPLESVEDEFNGGRHSAAAVQRFVRFAYQKWDARFLLLVGDGTLDPQNFRGSSGRDWIPVLATPGPVPVSEGYEIIPSDNRYACLTGNCDPIFGGVVVPELMVGRLPVNSLAETQTMVAKLVGYEDLSGDVSWRRRVLLHADDAYSGETFFGGGSTGNTYCRRSYEERFRTLNEKISSIITRDAGLSLMDVELFNQRYYEANEPFEYSPPADTCRPDRAATQTRTHANVTPILFSRLNSGVLWWNYQGHANEFVLSHEDIYRNTGTSAGTDDRFLFANDARPNLFSAFSCHANMFARPEHQLNSGLGPAIGEDLVMLGGGRGSIASWASVCYEVVPRDDSSHVNVELARSLFADPPRDAFLSERGSRVVLGEAIMATLLDYVPTVANYGYERGIAISYTLLGDPATRMSIGQPQTIVTANTINVVDGQPLRLHAIGPDLTLTADLVSTVRLDSLGLYEVSSAGTVPVPASAYTLSPAFPDTTTGSSLYGGRRYRLTYSAPLRAETYRYVLRTRDRDGLESQFTVLLQLDGLLRVNDAPINDGDDVAPNAALSMLLLSPRPVDPVTELTLTVNGQPQAFTAEPAAGDASGREWVLRWAHDPYPLDDYVVVLSIAGGGTITRLFTVSTASGDLKLSNLMAFPNPVGNEGTYFSFQLQGAEAADMRISIFTASGKVIRSEVVRGLQPGYHQLPWDAKDAEGSEIGNGVYLYRITAVTAGGAKVEQTGRLVKLRRPRRIEEPVIP